MSSAPTATDGANFSDLGDRGNCMSPGMSPGRGSGGEDVSWKIADDSCVAKDVFTLPGNIPNQARESVGSKIDSVCHPQSADQPEPSRSPRDQLGFAPDGHPHSAPDASSAPAPPPQNRLRGLRSRPAIEAATFFAPDPAPEEQEDIPPLSPSSTPSPPHTQAGCFRPQSKEEQVRRTLNNQYDILLRVPVEKGVPGRSICYGCNILPRTGHNLNRDTFSVVGRPVQDPRLAPSDECLPTSTPRSLGEKDDCVDVDNLGDSPSPPSQFSSTAMSRIEDSLEAIDQLEEQLESFDADTMIGAVCLPRGGIGDGVADASTTLGGEPAKPGALKGNGLHADEPPQSRRGGTVSGRGRKNTEPSPGTAARQPSCSFPERRIIRASKSTAALGTGTRISSTSEKLPTIGNRRGTGSPSDRKSLVDGRFPAPAAACTAASRLTKAKSSRQLARPSFELPGEAISRRKQADGDARLKAQEELERQKREFKARPVGVYNLHTYPRETVASRARQQTKAIATGGMQKNSPPRQQQLQQHQTARSVVNKGSSGSLRGAAVPPSRAHPPSPRGRTSVVGAPAEPDSRTAPPASTGNAGGKPSTVSPEHQNHQKFKGKEVYARDNKYSADRERERRERETAAKTARQEAAERSRQASREWAEKQRRKRLPAGSGIADPSSRPAVSLVT